MRSTSPSEELSLPKEPSLSRPASGWSLASFSTDSENLTYNSTRPEELSQAWTRHEEASSLGNNPLDILKDHLISVATLELGSGSQGCVFSQSSFDEDEIDLGVAYKKIYLKNNKHTSAEAAWREVYIHRLLTKKNNSVSTGIVALQGYKEDDEFILLAMEKCHVTLQAVKNMLCEWLADSGKVEMAKLILLDFFSSMLTALATLQAYNVSHCDIKPENIMLTTEPGLEAGLGWCLIDLGCASQSGTKFSREGQFCGSLPYIAPEALLFNKNIAARDIWAVGYILNELITAASEKPDLISCVAKRKEELTQAEDILKKQIHVFNVTPLPLERITNSSVDIRQYFIQINHTKMLRQFKENIETKDFFTILKFIIAQMMHPVFESRPSVVELHKMLLLLKKSLIFSERKYNTQSFLQDFKDWKEKESLQQLEKAVEIKKHYAHGAGASRFFVGEKSRMRSENPSRIKPSFI